MLEILLATVILGMALISLAIAVGRCVHGVSAARAVEGALDVAGESFEEWSLSVAQNGQVQTGSQEGGKVIRNRKYSWREITEPTEDPEVLQTTVNVRWLEGQREREKTFVRLMARSTRPSS